MNNPNKLLNRPLFAQNGFFNKQPFAKNASHDNTATPAMTQTTDNRPHTASRPTGHKQGQGKGKQGDYEPTQFDTNHKPDPVSFYARYGITLKGRQTNVRCCFHNDKSPSLSINKDTGAFYCFGCGVNGGDVIDFYQRYHGCDFITACQNLNIRQR